ncbi:MAG: HEAT repeat domain-containing protein, partial [Methanomassiliicoccaceae archaeon]
MTSERQERINEDLRSGERGRVVQALDSLNEMLRAREADDTSIPPLTVLLCDDDARIRREATWSVGKLAQNKAIDHAPLDRLIALLGDEDAEVRENAAWALGEGAGVGIGQEEAIERLNALLGDGSAQVRGMAVWALGRMAERMRLAHRSSIPLLEGLLDDKSL